MEVALEEVASKSTLQNAVIDLHSPDAWSVPLTKTLTVAELVESATSSYGVFPTMEIWAWWSFSHTRCLKRHVWGHALISCSPCAFETPSIISIRQLVLLDFSSCWAFNIRYICSISSSSVWRAFFFIRVHLACSLLRVRVSSNLSCSLRLRRFLPLCGLDLSASWILSGRKGASEVAVPGGLVASSEAQGNVSELWSENFWEQSLLWLSAAEAEGSADELLAVSNSRGFGTDEAWLGGCMRLSTIDCCALVRKRFVWFLGVDSPSITWGRRGFNGLGTGISGWTLGEDQLVMPFLKVKSASSASSDESSADERVAMVNMFVEVIAKPVRKFYGTSLICHPVAELWRKIGESWTMTELLWFVLMSEPQERLYVVTTSRRMKDSRFISSASRIAKVWNS